MMRTRKLSIGLTRPHLLTSRPIVSTTTAHIFPSNEYNSNHKKSAISNQKKSFPAHTVSSSLNAEKTRAHLLKCVLDRNARRRNRRQNISTDSTVANNTTMLMMSTNGNNNNNNNNDKYNNNVDKINARVRSFWKADGRENRTGGLANAHFNAYLRDRSAPFTSTTATPLWQKNNSTGNDENENENKNENEKTKKLQFNVRQSQEFSSTSFFSEWPVRPSLPAAQTTSDAAEKNDETTRNDNSSAKRDGKKINPAMPIQKKNILSSDRAMLYSLRTAVHQRLKRQHMRHVQHTFLMQYKIVKEVEGELTRVRRRLHFPDDSDAENASTASSETFKTATGEKKNSDAFTVEKKNREDLLCSLDALLFERVGQLQRSLQCLSPAHYAAAAALPVQNVSFQRRQHVEGGRFRKLPVLLKFLQRTTAILSHLQQLPGDSFGFLSKEQSESFARQSGARRAAQQAIQTLLTYPTSPLLSTTASSPPQNHDSNDSNGDSKNKKCDTSALKSEQLHRVIDLFAATLSLPYEDSPEIGGIAEKNKFGTNGAMSNMKAEEWCLRYVLESLHSSDASLSNNHTQKNTQQRLSLKQRVRILQACMMAQDEQAHFYLDKNKNKNNNHHHQHRRNDGLRFSFSPAKTSRLSCSVVNASGSKQQLRIPFGLGKEFTLQTIEYVMSHVREQKAAAQHHHNHRFREKNKTKNDCANNKADETNSGDADVYAHLYNQLSFVADAKSIASLCAAILFFDLQQNDAVALLAAAAPLCGAQTALLSGKETANLLWCYASLNFDGNYNVPSSECRQHFEKRNLFVILGTHAGELGDSLRAEDAVTVLRALDRVCDRIPSGTLRAALESSLRMRNLHRRTPYDAL